MNLIEEEPRKHPKPVPFSENPLLKPTVPEVSLLLQDKSDHPAETKNDSFSGTEFQTYNAWKWKHMNINEKISEPKPATQYKGSQNCVIKDKYSSSGIEKRKNEILYGCLDEPRRPLPPRISPVIPKYSESFFSNTSCEDLRSVCDENKERHSKQPSLYSKRDLTPSEQKVEDIRKDSSEKLYKIISEQNKQVEVFEKQIEQLLKLQDVKDKQIQQLLQSLDLKDKELEQLLRLKRNQDEQMQELLQSQAHKQKEYLQLLKKLHEFQRKDVCSVETMTDFKMVEASTNTSFECFGFQNGEVQEDRSVVRDSIETNRLSGKDKSLSLHSSDLPVIPENIPTPQSSIHLDIQDFHDLSDGSDTESRPFNNNNVPSSLEALSNPLGYTFYNNVLTQVKDIIENSGEKESKKHENPSCDKNVASKPSGQCNYVTEKTGRVQSFQTWGVLEREKILPSAVEHCNVEKYHFEIPNIETKDTHSPSDISLKINALALKYLKQEQISQYEISPQIPNFCQRDLTIYNVTNLSFGSMRYMDGYQVLPKAKGEFQQENNMPQNNCSPTDLLRRKKKISMQENFGNILDISTINQQPKLL